MSATVQLTRVYRFSAGHRLFHPGRSDDWNWSTFGKCSYAEGHGHNYTLEVSVEGVPDPESGMAISLDIVDRAVEREVMETIDHRNLNEALALEYGPVPTTEVLLLELWDRLEPWIERPARLCRLRIYETSKNTFEYFGPPRSRMAHG